MRGLTAAIRLRDNKNWWGKVLRRAKVKNFRWHDLRHTFCSRLAHRGVDTRVIQELAGHKTIQMSARYSHLNKTSVPKGLAVLEENIPEAKEKQKSFSPVPCPRNSNGHPHRVVSFYVDPQPAAQVALSSG